MPYLIDLTVRVAAGIGRLGEPMRQTHAHWLAAAQRPDGGFAGRQGESDAYYTGFGLRSLALLGALNEPQAHAAARFLQNLLQASGPSLRPADFISLVYSAVLLETLFDLDIFAAAGLERRESVVKYLQPLRRPDGGYAKSARSGASSTYHTFLALTCLELVGAPLSQPASALQPADLIEWVRARHRTDGGFVELNLLDRSGTNPTAAAVGMLRLLGGLTDTVRNTAGAMLAGMQNAEGGLRANQQIPTADLLSSFTGLVALHDLDATDKIDRLALGRYAESMARPGGGFRGGAWDNMADVEYTFYGLGTLGLLNG